MPGNGSEMQAFIEDHLCGQVDVYFCGHDHSLQWPEGTCGTEFVVSGAGSGNTVLVGTDPTWFESAEPGFLWVEVDGRTFTGVFYDVDGVELYRRSFTK
jgi:hypothetical protein